MDLVDCEHTIWEDFVANQARLHDNGNRYRERMRGAARARRAKALALSLKRAWFAMNSSQIACSQSTSSP